MATKTMTHDNDNVSSFTLGFVEFNEAPHAVSSPFTEPFPHLAISLQFH